MEENECGQLLMSAVEVCLSACRNKLDQKDFREKNEKKNLKQIRMNMIRQNKGLNDSVAGVLLVVNSLYMAISHAKMHFCESKKRNNEHMASFNSFEYEY